jgi:DNA-binding Xre family transcriptional regulator
MAVKRKARRAAPSRKPGAKRSLKPLKRTVRLAGKARPRAHIGSSFDDYLREEGTYEETQAVAIKRVLAWALAQEMAKKNITKAEMARRCETSRSQLDRLLDPDNADVRLDTLSRAARAVDCELRLELVVA